MQCTASLNAMQRAGGGGAAAAAAEPGGGSGRGGDNGGEAVAAAAASYRVLSRLLGYGGAESAATGLGLGRAVGETAAIATRDRGRASGLRGSQLLVFRPGETGEPSAGSPAGCLPPPPPPLPQPPPSELLCARHRCALLDAPKGDPGGGRCWSGTPGGFIFSPGAGLELHLAALGLHQAPSTVIGGLGKPSGDCSCLSLLPQPAMVPPPTLSLLPPGEETSDALLVLEALGPDEEDEEETAAGQAEPSSNASTGSSRVPLPAAALPVFAAAAAAAPSAGPASNVATPRPSSSAPSRKGSLKIRLSRLFRTKSCSGPSCNPGAAPGARRIGERELLQAATAPAPSGTAGSLPDVSQPGYREQDSNRKQRLMRTQSAFSPVAFGPLFTGETVSLVDVDISQRGLTSPHPPTPPPPPRRSLSLLDDISGTLPASVLVNPMGSSSLQSFPLPPPPPPHASEAFPRILPIRASEAVHSQSAQHLQCPLYRPDSSSFAASLRELEKCGWYWGPMNWEDAEMKLKGKPDGSFLVRDSSDPRYILSLSFRSQGITHHTRMEHYRGTFSLWCHPKFEDRCQSVVEFIKRAIMHSKNGKFLYFLRSRVPGLPPTPVQLLYPVSRFSNVKSLQHLCRFQIRQLVRIDHIAELPLPKPLIAYIRKFYYYDPQEEVYLSLKEAQLFSKQKQEADSST
ncbi:suppressor of cytokine signaling 7 isoform X2 [Crotalus tigris]|uniref:suppressor of cytokine signaling 7 isoform X2 n=1 Tax=Crotalus tigris TaxID=88082 RepID=UPI00192F3EE0|nr:suppressor of cytokine signaling 7 isoform X2 [Crotalus tigris]